MNEKFDINKLSKDLKERIKELECLYRISKVAFKERDNFESALRLILEIMPSGWQYPNLIGINLIIGEKEFGQLITGDVKQYSSISSSEKIIGKITVFFLSNGIEDERRTFLKEEQALLDQIAQEISRLAEFDNRKKEAQKFQEQLKRADRLKLLGEITAGIAHELNTPLGNILGYSQLLQSEEKSPRRKEDIKKVITSAKHATEIVKKLMFFSCEMPSNFKLVEVNKLVSESISLLQLQIRRKKIVVDFIAAPENPKAKLDPIQINQVLFNIILNSIDSMKENGKLCLRIKDSVDLIQIDIIDNGKGISKEGIQNLFKPFYTTKKETKGTGLGLAVSHGIIEGHKGAISVESEIGKGTKFNIKLPK